MSGEAMRWARDAMTGVHDGPYLLLLVLAWKHREGDISEPIYEIARAAHMSHSTVTRHLDVLQRAGALSYAPAKQRGHVGTITLHTDKVVGPDDLVHRSSGLRPIIATRSARLQTFREEQKTRRSAGVTGNDLKVGRADDLAPPDPPIRKSSLKREGNGSTSNGSYTPRERVYAELAELKQGDLTPADLTPRALAVLQALPPDHGWQLHALGEAWARTEGDHE